MAKVIRCPYCGDMLSAEDTITSDWFGDSYCDKVSGTCPRCEHRFSWDEVYTLNRIENLEELKNDDT